MKIKTGIFVCFAILNLSGCGKTEKKINEYLNQETNKTYLKEKEKLVATTDEEKLVTTTDEDSPVVAQKVSAEEIEYIITQGTIDEAQDEIIEGRNTLILIKNKHEDDEENQYEITINNSGKKHKIVASTPKKIRLDSKIRGKYQENNNKAHEVDANELSVSNMDDYDETSNNQTWIDAFNLSEEKNIIVNIAGSKTRYFISPTVAYKEPVHISFNNQSAATCYLIFGNQKQHIPPGKTLNANINADTLITDKGSILSEKKQKYEDYFSVFISGEIISKNTTIDIEKHSKKINQEDTPYTKEGDYSVEYTVNDKKPLNLRILNIVLNIGQTKVKDTRIGDKQLNELMAILPVSSILNIGTSVISLGIAINAHYRGKEPDYPGVTETLTRLMDTLISGVLLANQGHRYSIANHKSIENKFNEIVIAKINADKAFFAKGANGIGFVKRFYSVDLSKAILQALVNKESEKETKTEQWWWDSIQNRLTPNIKLFPETANATEYSDSILTDTSVEESLHTPFSNTIPFYTKESFGEIYEKIKTALQINYEQAQNPPSAIIAAVAGGGGTDGDKNKKIFLKADGSTAYDGSIEMEIIKGDSKKYFINQEAEGVGEVLTIVGTYDPDCEEEVSFYDPIYSDKGVYFKSDEKKETEGQCIFEGKVDDKTYTYYLPNYRLDENIKNKFHINLPLGKKEDANDVDYELSCCCKSKPGNNNPNKSEEASIGLETITPETTKKIDLEVEKIEIKAELCGNENNEMQSGSSLNLHPSIIYKNGSKVKVIPEEISWFFKKQDGNKVYAHPEDSHKSGMAEIEIGQAKVSLSSSGILSSVKGDVSQDIEVEVFAKHKASGKHEAKLNVTVKQDAYVFEDSYIVSESTYKCLTLTNKNGAKNESNNHKYLSFEECTEGNVNQLLTFMSFSDKRTKTKKEDAPNKEDDISSFGLFFLKRNGIDIKEDPDNPVVLDMILAGGDSWWTEYGRSAYGYYKPHSGRNQRFTIIKSCRNGAPGDRVMIKNSYRDGCIYNQNVINTAAEDNTPFLTTTVVKSADIENENGEKGLDVKIQETCSQQNNGLLIIKDFAKIPKK